MIRCLSLIGLFMCCFNVFADDDHSGHSDDLLLILKDKIALQKMIDGHKQLNREQQAKNLEQQKRLFSRLMPRLQSYVAIPENHYPNLEMYHESLKSRGALLADITRLVSRYQTLHLAAE